MDVGVLRKLVKILLSIAATSKKFGPSIQMLSRRYKKFPFLFHIPQGRDFQSCKRKRGFAWFRGQEGHAFTARAAVSAERSTRAHVARYGSHSIANCAVPVTSVS